MKTSRLILIGLFGSLVALGGWFEWFGPTTHQVTANATVLKNLKPVAHFELLDEHHAPFSNAELLNHWTLVFFGYRQCPDICPATLNIVREAFMMLPNNANVRFVFVNLVPEQDSPEALKAFLGQYNPQFKGLTGSSAALKTLMKDLGAYAQADTETQQLAHSSYLFLINPKAELSALLSPPFQSRALANDLLTLKGKTP